MLVSRTHSSGPLCLWQCLLCIPIVNRNEDMDLNATVQDEAEGLPRSLDGAISSDIWELGASRLGSQTRELKR